MGDIRRTRAGPRIRLRDAEVRLLGAIADDLDELLAGVAGGAAANSATAAPEESARRADPTADPLVELTGLDWPAAGPVEPPSDPALRRLLPDAYRDDDEAAADFRRYTDSALRGGKRADATVVRQALASIAVTGERILDDDQAQSWLRFLTDARLTLACRLGIETADDTERFEGLAHDDPRFVAFGVYEWLAAMLGELLEAIGAG